MKRFFYAQGVLLLVGTMWASGIPCQVTGVDTSIDLKTSKSLPALEITCPPPNVYAPLRVIMTFSDPSQISPTDLNKRIKLHGGRGEFLLEFRDKATMAHTISNFRLVNEHPL